MSFFTDLEQEAKTTLTIVGTFLKSLVIANVQAIIPIAQVEVTNLVAQEAQALASGNTKVTGNILAAAVKNTQASVVAAGINATANEILTAVGIAHSQQVQ